MISDCMLCSRRTKPQSGFDSFEHQTSCEVPLPDSSDLHLKRRDPQQKRKQSSKTKSLYVTSNSELRSAQMGGSLNQTKDSYLVAAPPLFTDRSLHRSATHGQNHPNLAASRHQTFEEDSPISNIVTTTQRQPPNILPFPAYPAPSHPQKIYNPLPITEVYQLDRFLDEIPDFRSISLSGDQARGRNERHRKALKTRLSVLEGLL
jgi:hypothetical protein